MPIINLINWDQDNASMVVSQYLRMKYRANVQMVSGDQESGPADVTFHEKTTPSQLGSTSKAEYVPPEIRRTA